MQCAPVPWNTKNLFNHLCHDKTRHINISKHAWRDLMGYYVQYIQLQGSGVPQWPLS